MGTKINDLPPVAAPVGTDELPISQDSGSGGRITYKTTIDQIKNYVKSYISTGTVTDVTVNSTDGSIGVIGSPIIASGTITLAINSVKLGKLDRGGAIAGQVLTYNGSAWVANNVPTELPAGTNGQFLTHNGANWVAGAAPTGGTTLPIGATGQVLTYNGTNWVANNVPTELPAGTNGQFLTHNGANWVAGAAPTGGTTLPIGATGQVLTYNGSAWVANNVPTELPAGTNGQFLTHNGANWVAGNVPTELPTGTTGQVLTYDGANWVAGAVKPTFISNLTCPINGNTVSWTDQAAGYYFIDHEGGSMKYGSGAATKYYGDINVTYENKDPVVSVTVRVERQAMPFNFYHNSGDISIQLIDSPYTDNSGTGFIFGLYKNNAR